MPWSRRATRLWLQIVLTSCTLYLTLYHLYPALQSHFSTELSTLPLRLDPYKLSSRYPLSSRLRTNLVVASLRKDDISWTAHLHKFIPNLNIIHYVSDDPHARYHPAVAKGREALIYFTYLQDFYNDLADITIFIHPHESPWHMDTALCKSLLFALAHLDLTQVIERGYFNLRTSAGDHPTHDCPRGFNTTKTAQESPSGEESLIAPVFRAHFPEESLPEIFAGPCCSQFAVSRASILSRPRSHYQRTVRLLIDSNLSDYMAGRPWERMWAYLFQKRAIDCNSEWRMLCRMYGVCFEGQKMELQKYERLWHVKVRLEEEIGFWMELWSPGLIRQKRSQLRDVEEVLRRMLLSALDRGSDRRVREEAGSEVLLD